MDESELQGIYFKLMVSITSKLPNADIDIRPGNEAVSQPDQTFDGFVKYSFGRPLRVALSGRLAQPPALPVLAQCDLQSTDETTP